MSEKDNPIDFVVIVICIVLISVLGWYKLTGQARAETVESCDWMYAKAKLYADRGEKASDLGPYDAINRASDLSAMYSQLYLACRRANAE